MRYLVPLGLLGCGVLVCFFFFAFFVFFWLTMPQIKSPQALLNVNKVFMLLTQSEGYTEMTTMFSVVQIFSVILLLLYMAIEDDYSKECNPPERVTICSFYTAPHFKVLNIHCKTNGN